MKQILVFVGAIMAVILALSALQSCNTSYMQAEAMREMAVAQGETAKAAQQAANSANTLAWTLGGSVLLLALALFAVVALVVFVRVRRELDNRVPPAVQQAPAARMITRPDEPQMLPAGDPIQQLVQLQMLSMMQTMQRDTRQLPAPRQAQPVDEEDWL